MLTPQLVSAALLATSLLLPACDFDDPVATSEPNATCCDCACGSEAEICLNVVTSAEPGTTCAAACAESCELHLECPIAHDASACSAEPSDPSETPRHPCASAVDRTC